MGIIALIAVIVGLATLDYMVRGNKSITKALLTKFTDAKKDFNEFRSRN